MDTKHTPWEADSDGYIYPEPSDAVASGEEADPNVGRALNGYEAAKIAFRHNIELARLRRVEQAARDVLEHCALIHTHWGDGDNTKQANAAEAALRAALED
jgi:hypothetical protein